MLGYTDEQEPVSHLCPGASQLLCIVATWVSHDQNPSRSTGVSGVFHRSEWTLTVQRLRERQRLSPARLALLHSAPGSDLKG